MRTTSSNANHIYEYFASYYHYDAETGLLYSRRTGRPIGSKVGAGYLRVSLAGHTYMVHRLAWLLVHGRWPAEQIDHINGIPDDNRLCNLREATAQQNLQSRPMHKRNQLGVKGVCEVRGRYRAQLWTNGRFVLNKYFDTIDDASAAYLAKSREVFGEWHRA